MGPSQLVSFLPIALISQSMIGTIIRPSPVFTVICELTRLGPRPATFDRAMPTHPTTHYTLSAELMKKTSKERQAGFSTLELLVVVAISLIISAIAVPSYRNTVDYLRAAGDGRALNGLTAQAKMRAAASFTHARVYADLSNGGYQLQVWDKLGNSGNGCWVEDSDRNTDANKVCITYTNSAPSGTVIALSQGNTFGFGSVTVGPTPGQSPIGTNQCYQDNGTSLIGNSACIVFNSRGIPVDSTNAPLATGAFYLRSRNLVEAVTASATGSIRLWSTNPTCSSVSCWHGQ